MHRATTMKRPRIDPRVWSLALAIVVLAVHAALFAGWVVDDAGITFAYARNFADGQGLVAQPGHPPVEGFSNPLWTLIIAGFFWTGLFADPITPKILGVGLAIAVVALIWFDLRRCRSSAAATALPLALIAASTPFVVWTTSGLENPMLAVLVIANALLAIRAADAQDLSHRIDAAAGLTVGLAAMTRPDAVVYLAIYPMTVFLSRTRREGLRAIVRRGAVFGVTFTAVYGVYLLFRLTYFGDWVPNTFHAKQKPSLAMASPGKLVDLVESASGDLWMVAILFLGGTAAWLLATGRLASRTKVLLAYLGVSAALYLVMPTDWMGEFRFATAFFPLFFWVLADLAMSVYESLRPKSLARRVVTGAALVFAVQLIAICAGRSLVFAQRPTVPLDDVEMYAGDGFNRLAQIVRVEHGSLLTPDLGGALLDSRLRVYDLAGLCDRRIALAIGSGDRTDLHRYVFEEMKPTFIHTHGAFTRAARLHDDPRFARDYVPIYEHVDGPPEWKKVWGEEAPPPWSGDYVRRDILGREGVAPVLAEYRRLGLDRFVPWTRPDDRLKAGWPQIAWALTIMARYVDLGDESIVPDSQ
jgi:hypothetical protein